MLSRLRPELTYANVVAITALVVALSGGAYAASSFVSSKGTIRGCVRKTSGALRVVHPDASCRAHKETALAWSQRGPRGPRGLRGLTGVGKPGVIFGSAVQIDGQDPNPTPDETAASSRRTYTFTLPAAGKTYIRFWSHTMVTSCSDTSEQMDIGLYVDGQPIPGTRAPIPGGGFPIELVGVPTLSAGQHTVEARVDCATTNVTVKDDSLENTFTVLLIG